MKILAIETSSSVGSVALCEDDVTILERSFERGMEHGRSLVPHLDSLLNETGCAVEDLALLAVSQGPGSYTGLRVGITCARTMAIFSDLPLVGVPSLDVLAENAPPEFVNACAIVDAKRGQLYAAFYSREQGGRLVRVGALHVMKPQEVLSRIVRPAFVLGDGLKVFSDVFQAEGLTCGEAVTWRPRAACVGRLGWRVFRERGAGPPLEVAPLYLRRPEADEKWEARMQTREQGMG